MNQAWNLRGDAASYKKFDKGWANEEPAPKKDKIHPDAPVQRSGMMSKENPLVNTHQFYKPSTNASKSSAAQQMYGKPPQPDEIEREDKLRIFKELKSQQKPRNEALGGYEPHPSGPKPK